MSKANPFMVIATLLMVGASVWTMYHAGDWRLSIIYAAYAVANAMLALMG